MRKATGDSSRARDYFSRYQRLAGGVRLGYRIIPRLVCFCATTGLDVDEQSLCANEVVKNLHVFSASGTSEWLRLKRLLVLSDDVVSLDRPAIFTAGKDRPILFTALAHAQVLLTLDRGDFRDLLGGSFYGLTVLLPSDFLERERSAGRLR